MCDDCCTHEITVALDTWIRPAQDWAHQHFIMDGGGANEISPFSEVIFSSVLWDGPSVGCECMLLPSVDNKAVLAYGRAR